MSIKQLHDLVHRRAGLRLITSSSINFLRAHSNSRPRSVENNYAEHDAFVVMAYLTDKPKAGEDLWPTK